MKSYFTIASILLLCTSMLDAQNDSDRVFSGCATDQLMNSNAQLQNAQKILDADLIKPLNRGSGNPVINFVAYTIPVVVHIIHNGGPENISDTQVQNAIANFNAKYAQNNGDQIQFCLAQRDPNGNATNGITRNISSLTTETMEVDDIALKNINRWAPTCYLNIWVVKEVLSSSQGSGVVGYAYLPSAHGLNMDGIVIEANYFGSSAANDAVGAHEIGHYFGLYHTFQNGCGNNNCLLDGDHVCDTPPDQTTFASCNPPSNSCSTDADDTSINNPFTSDVADNSKNYMDYSSISCYDNFSDGQYSRMVYFLLNVRNSLLSCKSCSSPCPLAAVTGSISIPPVSINTTTGSHVIFKGIATNAASFQWYINPSNVLSTGLSFGCTFNTMGSYWMKFRAISSNSTLCSDDVDSILIVVNQPVVVACSGSLNLDSLNSALRLPTTNQNYSSNGFTWECWFKLNTSLTGNNAARTMINFCDDVMCEDIALCFGWFSSPTLFNHLVFRVDGPNACAGRNPVVNDYLPPGGFVTGTWYHAAGVMDYTNHISKLFLNGQLVSSITNNAVPITRVGITEVGYDAINTKPLNPVPPLGANVDEIRIWKAVRTDADILANYNKCLQGNEANLLSYYRCNQSAGSAAVDASVNLNNGTLYNGAAWSSQEPAYIGVGCYNACVEICGNGIDDNSNGLTDEGCACPVVTVSNDTTICKGSSSLLTAAGASLYSWSPSIGLSSTTGTAVTANPTVTTTYTVATTHYLTNAGNQYSELVFNWDFSLGNTGFTNDHTFQIVRSCGVYYVSPAFFKTVLDSIEPDHTSSSDNMMLCFDGKTTVSRLWEQTITTISKNQDYKFSFWAMRTDVNGPHFEVHFIGDVTGDVIVSNEFIQPWTGSWFVWDEYSSLIWNSQANNNVTIRIMNLQTNCYGDDFAMDDVSLKLVSKTCKDTAIVKVTVNNGNTNTVNLGKDTTICTSGTYTLHAGSGFEEYKWQDGSTDSVFTAFGTGKYWVRVKNYCSSVYLSDTVLITLVSTPSLDLGKDTSACKKDSIVLSYSTNGVYSTFHWFPDSGLSCTTCPSPLIYPINNRKYYLSATTAAGCTNIDSINVKIDSICLSVGFSASDSTFCIEEGKCIDFTDISVGTPTAWKWLFSGAVPDTSTQKNPTGICYFTPGSFTVTLIIFNSTGSDTLSVSPMIKVASGATIPIITVSHDTLFCTHAASYQWFLNGSPISGAIDSFYVIKGDGTYAVQIIDDIGCASVSGGLIISSVTEFPDKILLTIYPNPTNSSFTLRFNARLKEAEITIYNVLGQEMMRKKLSGDIMKIENGILESGVYFIKVNAKEKEFIQKLIVE